MTARAAWRLAWRRSRQAIFDNEPPSISDAYAWTAWLLIWARGAEPRLICPADGRPWRLPR